MPLPRTRLTFNAIPFDLESPRSLLLRLAGTNGFSSANEMAKNLTGRAHFSTNELFVRHGRLFEELDKEARELSDRFQACFLVGQQLGTGDNYVYHGSTIPDWAMGSSGQFRNCPACAEQGWFDMTTDLSFVRCCHRHNLVMHERCSSCNHKLNVSTCIANRCKCGSTLSEAPRLAADANHIACFFQLLLGRQTRQLKHFFEFLDGYKIGLQHSDEYTISCVAEALEYSKSPKAYLAQRVDALLCTDIRLPRRALMAAELVSKHPILRRRAERLAREATSSNGAAITSVQPSQQRLHFSRREVATALMTTESMVDELITAGALTPSTDNAERIDGQSLSTLYQALVPQRVHKRTYTSTGGDVLPVAECIAGILRGQFHACSFNPDTGLKGLRTGLAPILRTPPSPRESITVIKASEFCHTNRPTMLRAMFRTSSATVMFVDDNGVLHFSSSEFDTFHKNYVTASELSFRLKTPKEDVVERLERTGINPFYSSPQLGLGSHIFLRSQVVTALSGNSKVASELHQNLAMVASRVEKLLGIPANQLHNLVRPSMLEVTYTGHRKIPRYTTKSVYETKKWLAENPTFQHVLKSCRLTADELRNNYLAPHGIKPTKYGTVVIIKKEDYEKIRMLRGHSKSRPS